MRSQITVPGFPSRPSGVPGLAHPDLPRRCSCTLSFEGSAVWHIHPLQEHLPLSNHAHWMGSDPVSGVRAGQSQPGWRDLVMVGAGSQPGLQPWVPFTSKSVHAWALQLLEKKLLRARGLPCCEVQSGEAAGCASGTRGRKVRFGCCPCCRVLVTHLQKATTVHDALV